MVRVHLVGELSVEVDGERRELPPGRPAELFAWLALHPGLHPRSSVAGRFWPDVLDASARASLRNAVWAIRRVLGTDAEGALVATRDRIGLADGDAVWVDARDPELLDQVDGELLPGIEEEWAIEARDEQRRRRVEVLAAAANQAETRGERARALALTRQQAELDPLSEQVHRSLIRRLADSGEASAALAAHATFRTRMLATLRIGPSVETERVAEEIRRGTGTEVREVPPPLLRADRDPFVGRESELRLLRALWSRVAIGKGRAQLALLVGEPGIGKTRLAARFAREVHEAGGAVLYGVCLETALRPYEPFAEALRSPLHGAEAVTAVEERLGELAADRPILLVVDDLHWSDRGSLALLGQLVRTPFAGKLAVLAAYRETGAADPQLREAVADVRRHCDVERLRLEGLPENDVRFLLTSSLGTDAASDRAGPIHRRTDGNPFFVRELARHMLDGEGGDIPDAVREVVSARVARLPAQCAEIVSTASVLGDPFPVDLLAEVAGVDEELVIDHLDEAAEAGLVEELGPSLYAFVHTARGDRDASPGGRDRRDIPACRRRGQPGRRSRRRAAGLRTGRDHVHEGLATGPAGGRGPEAEANSEASDRLSAAQPPALRRTGCYKLAAHAATNLARSHLVGYLEDPRDAVTTKCVRVLPDHGLVGGLVHAEARDRAGVVHADVTVVPCDLGEALRLELLGA
jgi:DNA-binding SARP family transcriptional activator